MKNTLEEISIEDLIRKKVHISKEKLETLIRNDDIKLLRLLKYLKKRR